MLWGATWLGKKDFFACFIYIVVFVVVLRLLFLLFKSEYVGFVLLFRGVYQRDCVESRLG